MTKYLYILPLLAALTFSLTAQAEKPMTKEEFYTKHNIVGDSLIPPSFDMEAFKKALVEDGHSEERANQIIEDFKKVMRPPIIFEGFNTPVPHDDIEFCDTRDYDCLKKIGFSQEEMENLFPLVSDEDLKESELTMTDEEIRERIHSDCPDPDLHRMFSLIGKVGQNLYLSGVYGDFGSVGAYVGLSQKKDSELVDVPEINMQFFCYRKKPTMIHLCEINPVASMFWYRRDYEPLNELILRYLEVSRDYIHQYIQRKEDEND